MKKLQLQKPEINNLAELAIWSESVKNALKLKDDYFCVGATGIKVQMEKQKQGKYADLTEAMLVYFVPSQNENGDLELLQEKIWIDKSTGDVIEEPEWFKEYKNEEKQNKNS